MARAPVAGAANLLARVWVTAALASFLLPSRARLGLWLPLHLALAGGAATAIAGNMQAFALGLTAAPPPRRWVTFAPLVLVAGGALLVVMGRPLSSSATLVAGGALYLGGLLVLGVLLLRARMRARNRRHGAALTLYAAAIAAGIFGGVTGALIGSGTVGDPLTLLALRRAHIAANMLGWTSLAIAGTLITFLPAALRVRMPAWNPAPAAAAAAGGMAALVIGLALRADAVAAAGALAFAGGALGFAWMGSRAFRTTRRHAASTAARHFLAALAWLAVTSVWLAALLSTGGAEAVDRSIRPLVAMLGGGLILQTLLGAWLYLLPGAAPGGPERRRLLLAAMEHAGRLQVTVVNAGLALLVLGFLGSTTAATAGAALAAAGTALALGKAWGYRWLAGLSVTARRAAEMWPRDPR